MKTIIWRGPQFVGPADGRRAALATRRDGSGVAWIVPNTERCDEVRELPAGFALPGFIDTHAHLGRLGQRADALNIAPDERTETVERRVRERVEHLDDRETQRWILGRGWLAPEGAADDGEPKFPQHDALSRAAPHVPVALKRADEHAIWVNARAMEIAGVDSGTPSPEGGAIIRGADGRPTGVLVDAAMALIEAHVPLRTHAETREVLRQECAAFLRHGVTCVHEMAVDWRLWRALAELAEGGALPLRVRAFLRAGDPENADAIRQAAETPGPAMLCRRGIKGFMDGALGSRGARLSQPYADGTCGLRVDSDATLREAARAAAAGGYQLALHAIGDRAVGDAIDLIQAHMPAGDARWRVEHAQFVTPPDVTRLARSGICAAVQPIHGVHDLPWAAPRLSPTLRRDAYRWQSLRRRGVRLGLGTDHPIESMDVRETLLAATLRRAEHRDGRPLVGQRERLSRGQALHAYWRGAAELAFDEAWLGALRPGFVADFAVWDTDLTTCSPAALREARCLATVVDGQVVHRDAQDSSR